MFPKAQQPVGPTFTLRSFDAVLRRVYSVDVEDYLYSGLNRNSGRSDDEQQ